MWKLVTILYICVILIVSRFYSNKYFGSRPLITNTDELINLPYLDEKKPIIIYFDKPFDSKTIQVKTAPGEFGTSVSFISPFDGIMLLIKQKTGLSIRINYFTALKVMPKHSIPYDTGLIYYIIGIQSLSGKGGTHEHSLTLNTPLFPKEAAISIQENLMDVPISEPFVVSFNQPITGSLNYELIFTPEVKFTASNIGEKELQISFDEPLVQSTKYSLELSINRQNVNLETRETEELSDPITILATEFETVTPPGIKKVLPEGKAVVPTASITFTFSEFVNQKSVQDNFSIVPEVPYTTNWVIENQQVEFKPLEPFMKSTEYVVTLGGAVQTLKGGKLAKDFVHTFETIGVVKVLKTTPRNGSTGNSASSSIQITFDQLVDKASAQRSVAISPKTSVTYSWKGNTLTVNPKTSLVFSTKYNIIVKSGIKSINGLDSTSPYNFSFTTRPQVVSIWVPGYKQGYGTFDCNVVSLQMALAAKGVSASASGIKSTIGYGTSYNNSSNTGGNPNSDFIGNYGVHWDPIAQYARSRGRKADVKRGWSLSGIAGEINKGNPVVIFWYNGLSNQTRYSWHYTYGAKPGLHSVVVYGYKGDASNPTGFYVRDPWPSFYQVFYSSGSFLNKWSYFGYTAVVVK